MKESTLRALITARALFEQAEQLCATGERHSATAGIIVLQDSVELVLLAMLVERDVDEQKSLESLTFDQMIGELRSIGVSVKKSGTLKAMNKLRVTAKHYGQIMEPITVQGHFNAARFSLDSILKEVVDKTFREIYLAELIPTGATKEFLESAAQAIDGSQWMDALLDVRRALFLEFERDYCIYPYRDRNAADTGNDFLGMLSGGWKAPYWTKNKEWIAANVKTPFDYVQIDLDRMRLDALEWGVNTQALNNARRLTPEAIRLEYNGDWFIRCDADYPANSATQENAIYCLDLAIDVIRRKRAHQGAVRIPNSGKSYNYPPAYVGQHMYDVPDVSKLVLKTLQADDRYVVKTVLNGFVPQSVFYKIECTSASGESTTGYVQRLSQPLETPSTSAEEAVAPAPSTLP